MVPYLLVGVGTTYGQLGQLTAAQSSIDNALEAALLTGSNELHAMALAQKSWLSAWRGNLPEASRVAEQAITLKGPVSDWFSAIAHGMLAQCRLYTDDPDACVTLLVTAGGGPDLPALDPVTRIGWFELLAQAEAARHQSAEAVQWADRAQALAATMNLTGRRGFGQLAQALARHETDPAGALTYANAAQRSFAACGDQVQLGRAHLAAGVALGSIGDTDAARTEFNRATQLFDACGTVLFQNHTRQALRRLNARRPRRSRRDGPVHQLTERELEIARLASSGLTNRQIAERLYLSPKTVEVHLSRGFAKLGISTRAALAGCLAKDPRCG
jgi:DNA-binding CsgD family transcriptional regulator